MDGTWRMQSPGVLETSLVIICTVLVMADVGHFGMPKWKKSKWLHARNILIQLVQQIKIFSISDVAIFNNTSHLDWSIYM